MINLFTSFYETSETLKQDEMMECINKNVANKFIDKIYILNESDKTFESNKIVNLEIYQRPDYNLFFKIINRKCPDDINIIANSDIYLDETIELVKHISVSECYALTRYDEGVHMNVDFSQDVWVFKGKISPINGGIYLGRQACDQKIAYEIKSAGYFIDNPSLTIKVHHLHKSTRNWDLSGEPCKAPLLYIKPDIQYVRKDNTYDPATIK